MGIGPVFAIPKALEAAKLRVNDIDIFEINEAFASQCAYSQQKLGIPDDKINPRGGAIAMGHPFAMSGSRLIVTLFNELKGRDQKHGVGSVCIASGMGAAAVFERE